MPASPAAPLRAAAEAALRASAALRAAMVLDAARIYTEVPANALLPYVVLGQVDGTLDRSGCAAEGEFALTVTLWSRTDKLDKGAQAHAMGGAVIDALAADLGVAGWDVIARDDDISEAYAGQADQSTRGVLVFQYLLTEQVA